MFDSILYFDVSNPIISTFKTQGSIVYQGDGGKCLCYSRSLDVPRYEGVTVLSSTSYIGIGTSKLLFSILKNNKASLDIYNSVYKTSPYTIKDSEGNTITITPPFEFGVLVEDMHLDSGNMLFTYKTDIWQRCTDDEADELDAALQDAPARKQRMWNDAITIEHSSEYYPILRELMIGEFGEARTNEILAPSVDVGGR